MNIDLVIVVALALLTGLTVFFFVLGVARVLSPQNSREALNSLIDQLKESEIALDRKDSNLPAPNTWSGLWYKMAAEGGQQIKNPSQPGLLAMGFALIGFGIGFFIWPGNLIGGISNGGPNYIAMAGGGILISAVGPVILWMMYTFQRNARLKAIDKQLPNLLSGLRANLQANLTPQQAIVNQAKEFPAPLGVELRQMTDEMSLGLALDQSLQNFADRSKSRELKFLVSAIRIAISSGADLDPLVATIQDIVVQRTRIANHLATAISRAQPALWVTGIMVPAAFIWSFYSSETNQAFWMSFPLGLIMMALVAFFYGLALVVANMQVRKIKNA